MPRKLTAAQKKDIKLEFTNAKNSGYEMLLIPLFLMDCLEQQNDYETLYQDAQRHLEDLIMESRQKEFKYFTKSK